MLKHLDNAVNGVANLNGADMRELSQWAFDIYALPLPRGHGFGSRPPIGAWISDDGLTCAILMEQENLSLAVWSCRRCTHQLWRKRPLLPDHKYPTQK